MSGRRSAGTPSGEPALGSKLRTLREREGWSLREVATKAGVNHGYLSQLERGDVAAPTPAMLHKLAEGYGQPFIVLMRWAGYLEGEPGLTTNQARALSYLGGNPSNEEVAAVKAVLEAIRRKGATFPQQGASLDVPLSPHDRHEIGLRAERLLQRADVEGVIPTPLDQLLETSRLVAVGEITLDEAERRQLRARFGALVDRVLDRLRGAIHFPAREVWVNPEMYDLKKRFVTCHEIGHNLLEWQRDVLAYLDDEERLRPDVRILYERQSNQAAIELLAQGDALRERADDSRLTIDLLSDLSSQFEISLQAAARRIIEETKQQATLAVRFRGSSGRLGPYHHYCSKPFTERFGWHVTGLPAEATSALRRAIGNGGSESMLTPDRSGALVSLTVEAVNTPRAILALMVPARTSRKRLLRVR